MLLRVYSEPRILFACARRFPGTEEMPVLIWDKDAVILPSLILIGTDSYCNCKLKLNGFLCKKNGLLLGFELLSSLLSLIQ